MIQYKPIHLCLRVAKNDIEHSKSYCKENEDYIWWSYQAKKRDGRVPISEARIHLLNENITHFNNNLVYFIAENGDYVQKAKLFAIEGRGIKNDEHVPQGWEGEAILWVKCNYFEDSNLNELKSLLLESDRKPYLNFDRFRRFRNQGAVNLVISLSRIKTTGT